MCAREVWQSWKKPAPQVHGTRSISRSTILTCVYRLCTLTHTCDDCHRPATTTVHAQGDSSDNESERGGTPPRQPVHRARILSKSLSSLPRTDCSAVAVPTSVTFCELPSSRRETFVDNLIAASLSMHDVSIYSRLLASSDKLPLASSDGLDSPDVRASVVRSPSAVGPPPTTPLKVKRHTQWTARVGVRPCMRTSTGRWRGTWP